MQTNHKIINITNITFSYNQREDRLIFTINHTNIDQRIDFFVTRRMLIQLLDAFDNILINYCNNGELFKKLYNNQEELKTNKRNDKKVKDEKESTWEKSIPTNTLNFTKIKDPILLDSVSLNINNDEISLKFISNNKLLAISKMNLEMFQKTLSSMMRVIPFISWGISKNILD